MTPILEVSQLTKTFKTGDQVLHVVNDVNFVLHRGESCAIVGPSGSGKTTLLGLCAGLDNPTSGSVLLNGQALEKLNEDEKAEIRNKYVGFIFQNFNLLPSLTALENVMIPPELQNKKNARKIAANYLEQVGLGDRLKHYPAQLSGGEQQRVAIARAFANEPLILFADEPTGNLDAETGSEIENLLFDLNKDAKTTLVIVTHDIELAKKTEKIMTMRSGKIVSNPNSF